MLDWSEIPSIAQTYLDRANVDPYSPIPVIKVAEAAGIVVAAKWNLEEEASIDHSCDPPRMKYRRSLRSADARYRIAHECGEDHCYKIDYRGDDRERVCDAIGACILIPEAGLRRFFSRLTAANRVQTLYRHYMVPPRVAALRLSLWVDEPMAVADRASLTRYGDWGPHVGDADIRGNEIVAKMTEIAINGLGMRTACWRKR